MFRHPRRLIAALLAGAGICALTAAATAEQAQAPLPSPVFRGTVDLVTVPLSVTNRDGDFVPGLRQSDFVVRDAGRPQEIVAFSSEYVPVSLAIALDVSGSMTAGRLASARFALTTLFDRVGPDDELWLTQFADYSRTLARWTSDRARLQQALTRARRGTYTALYDAVEQLLPMIKAGKHPRKVVLVISDGDDTASEVSLKALRQAVRESDIMVYAIGVEDDDARTGVNAGALRDLTDDSGGRTQIAKGFDRLGETVARFASELSHQYVLAYAPPPGRAGDWREIKVEVPGRKVTVRARRGYIAR